MKSWVLCFLIGAFTPLLIFSQGRTSRGTISGTVVDADDKMPVMQATVQVLSPADSTMVTGNVTDMDGTAGFVLRNGRGRSPGSFVYCAGESFLQPDDPRPGKAGQPQRKMDKRIFK